MLLSRAKDLAFRVGTRVHRAVVALSGGRILGRAAGMPVVVLTTTGRRTGRERSTVLTVPVTQGSTMVLVASYAGDDRHPQWYLNLRADPRVTVAGAGGRRDMSARTATGAEVAELWPRVVAAYAGYDRYRARTDRDIPLVILEPRG